jgi:hypothetical protein
MALAYAVTNALSSLAATAFTWSTADTTNRAYLNDRRMDKVFIATAAVGGITLVIDMGGATQLAGIAVLNSNVASATAPTLRVRAADDAAITVNVVTPKAATTLDLTAPRHKDHVLQFAAATKRYWELTWVWTGSFALRVGELFAFTSSTQLTRSGIYGSGGGERFKSIQTPMEYGTVQAMFLAGPIRSATLKWQDHTASNMAELQALWRATKGIVKPFLFVPSYEATGTAAADDQQECIYGRLLGPGDDFDFTQPDFNLFNPPDFTIMSEGREVGA